MPQAGRVQYGAPDPPENRDHCKGAVNLMLKVEMVTTHNVLMWIHHDSEAILLAFSKHADDVVHEVVVIFSSTQIR